jgi:hypothetical protein
MLPSRVRSVAYLWPEVKDKHFTQPRDDCLAFGFTISSLLLAFSIQSIKDFVGKRILVESRAFTIEEE